MAAAVFRLAQQSLVPPFQCGFSRGETLLASPTPSISVSASSLPPHALLWLVCLNRIYLERPQWFSSALPACYRHVSALRE